MNQAGIFFGPQILGRIKNYGEFMFPLVSQDLLGTISLLGYTLFLFLSGVKMDMSIIFRTGRRAMYIGACSLILPLIVGMTAQKLLGDHWGLSGKERLQLILATATHSLTPFPVISCLLSELKILNSEIGRLGLSAAVVSDLFSTFLTSIFRLAKVAYDQSTKEAFMDFGIIIVFLLLVVFVARPAMYWMIRQTPEGRPVRDTYIYTIIFAVLCSGLLSNWFNQLIVFGPFIFGLAVPDGPPLGSTLVNKFDCMVSGVLLPVFVTTSMMKVNLSNINFHSNVAICHAIVLVIVIIAKFGGCWVLSYVSKIPKNDAITLSLIMSCKGVVEMADYSFARGNNVR